MGLWLNVYGYKSNKFALNNHKFACFRTFVKEFVYFCEVFNELLYADRSIANHRRWISSR